MTEAAKWEDTIEWVGMVAGCIVNKDGKFLLVQEKQQKVYGLWNLPAGHVDKGESLEAAAAREVLEETGYEVEVGKEKGLFHEHASTPVKHIFEAKIIGGELKIQEDEILDVKWLSFEEVEQLSKDNKLRAPWIIDIVRELNKSDSS